MADLSELAIAAGAGGGGTALLMKALGWFGQRTVSTFDKALDQLEKAIKEQGSETKQLIGELTREMRTLRDTDIRQAEQIGALQQAHKALQERVDGQGTSWREEYRRLSERLPK